jgi:1-acyl-sn-glycerol-3-phosphate acyltransferase
MIRLILVMIFLILYFIISLPVQLAELIIQHFNMDLRNRSSLKFVQGGLKIVSFLAGVKLEVNGLENVPDDQACLFIGNHTSFFDIVLTYPLMKQPTGYIAKKEIKKVPFLSWWMYFVNCIFLDRTNPRAGLKSVIAAADMIKNGTSVFLFPEGTRSVDGKLGEFKDGGFKIATKSKCPVVPVGIKGSFNILERQFPRIKSAKVVINFGKPVYTKDMDKADMRLLPALIKEEVKKLSGQ